MLTCISTHNFACLQVSQGDLFKDALQVAIRTRTGFSLARVEVVSFVEVVVNARFATSVLYTIQVDNIVRTPAMVEPIMVSSITLGDITDLSGNAYMLLDEASIAAPGVLRYRFSAGVYLREPVLLDDVDSLIENLQIEWRGTLVSVTSLTCVFGLQEEVVMPSG